MVEYLTGPQAAAELGVLDSTVRHAIRRKRLKAIKRGRDWYITRAEVERYKAERHNSGRPYKSPDAGGEGTDDSPPSPPDRS